MNMKDFFYLIDDNSDHFCGNCYQMSFVLREGFDLNIELYEMGKTCKVYKVITKDFILDVRWTIHLDSTDEDEGTWHRSYMVSHDKRAKKSDLTLKQQMQIVKDLINIEHE